MRHKMEQFRTWRKAHALNELGMEAAQVIVILAIVAAVIFPIIRTIANTVESKGSVANNCLANAGGTTASC